MRLALRLLALVIASPLAQAQIVEPGGRLNAIAFFRLSVLPE